MKRRLLLSLRSLRWFFYLNLITVLMLAPCANGQERERVRVSTLFIGSSLLPLWIGQEQGLFAHNGVDVELIWMQSTLSTSALLAGDVDAIFGTPQSIFAALLTKSPPPLVTIAAWSSASEHWLMVNPAVRTAKDLEGKTLATSRPRSADHGYMIVLLERLGVDPRRTTFIAAGGQAGRAAAVESGSASGSAFNRYYSLQLKRKGFREMAKLERPDYPFPPSVIVVRKDILQTKRKGLKAFLTGMMQSTEKQKTDKELSLRLIRKNLRLQNAEVIEAAYEDGITLSYPFFTERQFQVSLELMAKSGGQPVELSYKQAVDHSLLEEITRPAANRPG
jgi:NitT/TauT family transport system substrate-binding protein